MKRSMGGLRTGILLLLLVDSAAGLGAQEKVVALSPAGDSITAGTALVSVIVVEIIMGQRQLPALPSALSVDRINPFDRAAVFPWSRAPDVASDITQAAAVAAPALLALGASSRDWLDIGVMYFEAAAIAYGVKNILKLAMNRYRPYLYSDHPPAELIAGGEYADSFPSGHATMAFAGATFFTYMFGYYHPGSSWIFPVAVGSYGLAAATAVLRVTSGNHFMTDVLAGAAIGTLSGFLVPFFHLKRSGGQGGRDTAVSLDVGINAVGVRLQF
jgi:undecaprenyl-diphosphatase